MKGMKKSTLVFLFLFLFVGEAYSQSGWVQQNSGVTSILRATFFLNVNTGFAVGNSKLRTTNGGLNWVPIIIPYDSYDIQFVDSSIGYIVGFFKPVTLQKSTNGGVNWTTVTFPLVPGWPYFSMKFFNSNTGFINTSKTTNGGLNWANTYPSQTMHSICFLNENTGWECNNYGTVIKTTDGGTNWTYINVGSGIGLQSIFFINENTGWAVSSSSRVYKSTNGGINWTMIYNQGLCGLNTLYFVNEQTGWIAGCEGAINKTTNGGMNWTLQSLGSTTYLYDMQFVNEFTGWAVGANGKILKTTTGGLTFINVISAEIPNHFSLSQNYPNPFNPNTKIKFQISELSQAKLIVYDVLGKEIAALVNEHLNAGAYEVDWDASNYPSGVYLYKLQTEVFTETKKMVLLK